MWHFHAGKKHVLHRSSSLGQCYVRLARSRHALHVCQHATMRTHVPHPTLPPPPVLASPQLHSRFVKMWAKRILAMPEQALVPLNERDSLLASKFEVRGGKWGGGHRHAHDGWGWGRVGF